MMHLFHPALVHFSVAFLITGAVAEAWGLLRRKARVARFGAALLVLGTVSLIPTVLSGYVAANTVDPSPDGRALLDAHERNAWFVLALFTILLFWKGWFRGQLPEGQRVLYAGLLIGAALLTTYSALLGGEMVYLLGVGVR